MGFKEDHKKYITDLDENLPKVSELDLAKKRLTYIRWKVSENLDKLLFEFETNVKKAGSGIIWCPDEATTLEALNNNTRNFSKVRFMPHTAVKQLVNTLDLKVPEKFENPDAVVIGAKFIMANTGNFYSVFKTVEEYHAVIAAKKIIVIAGIDCVLSSQSELQLSKQLYSIFETGNLGYLAEITGKPGRPRGLKSEITLLLTDNNKSRLLDDPKHRPLFSLLNFDLPPVCPMQQLSYDPENWKKLDTLNYLLYPFLSGLKDFPDHVQSNYGLSILDRYLPYDIDLYDQVLDARAFLHKDDKRSVFNSFLDLDKSGLISNPKKFKDLEKFKKYAEHNFFGTHK